MAFPVDQDRVGTNSTVSSTTHNLNLPASIAAGDILLAVIRTPALADVTWPAGWDSLDTASIDASDDRTSVAWRYADGTEGATITVTLSIARILVGLCYRITGGRGVTIGTAAIGSATQPDSPNLTGILPAARDVLWLSIGGCDDSEALTSGPASYANATVQGSTATGASGCTVFVASRQLNAASEDPGAWTLGTTSIWTAWTVAVTDAPIHVTQVPVEVGYVSDVQAARVTQETVEVAVNRTDAPARVTQVSLEVAVSTNPPARLTQEPVEALVQPTTQKVRLTQEPVEVLAQPTTQKVRLTQMPVEVLILPTPITAQPFRAYIID